MYPTKEMLEYAEKVKRCQSNQTPMTPEEFREQTLRQSPYLRRSTKTFAQKIKEVTNASGD
jgi:uncharacterized protein YnzC (UPF0291/DUF896 family)